MFLFFLGDRDKKGKDNSIVVHKRQIIPPISMIIMILINHHKMNTTHQNLSFVTVF